MIFSNKSNLLQQIRLQISEGDRQQCGLTIPDEIELEPDDYAAVTVPLIAQKRRSLFGREQRLLFRVAPKLRNFDSDANSTRPDPTVQVFELRVKPLIPLLWQIVTLLFLLLLLLAIFLLNPINHHHAPVNSVRLIENGHAVVSGSSDGTVRRWQVNSILGISHLSTDGQTLGDSGKSVRVVRQKPERDSQVAVGLGNGNLELWNVSQKSDPPATPPEKQIQENDRVFGLDFTKNSDFLFSGHGSGLIRRWQLQSDGTVSLADQAYPKFAISALALSEGQNSFQKLAIAGTRYNKIALWDWDLRRLYDLKYEYRSANNNNKQRFVPVSSQQDYIESLSIADSKNLLVTVDSNGYTTLWNMEKIRQCIARNSIAQNSTKPQRTDGLSNRKANALFDLSCKDNIHKQWYDEVDGQTRHLRSVAFSQDGCYLARVGDDGRVMFWQTSRILGSPDHEIETVGENLDQWNLFRPRRTAKLNSVDIHAFDDHVLVVTGDDRNRVRAFRTTRIDSSCKSATSPA